MTQSNHLFHALFSPYFLSIICKQIHLYKNHKLLNLEMNGKIIMILKKNALPPPAPANAMPYEIEILIVFSV